MIERTKDFIKEVDYGYVPVDKPVRSVFPEYDKCGRMRLSVSRMQLFEKCAMAFKFSYLDKLELGEEREGLDTGISLHDLFYYISFQRNPAVIRSNVLYGKYTSHCENFIKFQQSLQKANSGSRPMFAEKEIFDEEDFVVLYIDRINDLGDGTVEILDYKTGGSHSMSRHQFQLALYTYYAEKHLKLRVSRWSVYYSRDNKYKSMSVNRKKVAMVPEFVRLVRERIDECFAVGNFEKRPNTMCSFCSYLQFGLCNSDPFKSFNCFGLLEIYSKSWGDEDEDGSEGRMLFGGIRVTS
jgi:CRISPR/Cas system-associated exonuclease Cas4 (RecB family)